MSVMEAVMVGTGVMVRSSRPLGGLSAWVPGDGGAGVPKPPCNCLRSFAKFSEIATFQALGRSRAKRGRRVF